MTERKIIHIDMDAFYASVEQRDNPELRGKPVAVGHAEERGVVAAASYGSPSVRGAFGKCRHRRQSGCVRSLFLFRGVWTSINRCPRQIHEIFHEYTDVIEPISLDEACLWM